MSFTIFDMLIKDKYTKNIICFRP